MGAARRRGSAERAAHAPGHVRWASEAGVDASGIGALRTEAEPALSVPKGLEFPNRNHRYLCDTPKYFPKCGNSYIESWSVPVK